MARHIGSGLGKANWPRILRLPKTEEPQPSSIIRKGSLIKLFWFTIAGKLIFKLLLVYISCVQLTWLGNSISGRTLQGGMACEVPRYAA